MEFEWNIFPGFTTLHLSHKVQELLLRLSVTPEKFAGRLIFMSIQRHLMGIYKQQERMRQILNSFLSMVVPRTWIRETVYSISEDSTQGETDQMMLTFVESGHPVIRVTSPMSRGVLKSKGGGKLSIHCYADFETIETVFRTIFSVNQLSLYGAIAEKV